MDMVTKARELGKAIQSDEKYLAFAAAKTANDKDEALQGMIGEFNLKRIELSRLMNEESESEKAAVLDSEIKELYVKIMANENMVRYQAAKKELDNALSGIMNIIDLSIKGEDPETAPATVSSCGGNCSGCSGCK